MAPTRRCVALLALASLCASGCVWIRPTEPQRALPDGVALPRFEEIPVATAMARQVLSVHQNATVEQAEAIMRGGQVRRIPVLDQDRRPIGIISVNDLARHAARARRAEVDREILLTVAAICQPHAHVGVGEMDHSTGAPIAV